MTATNFSHSRFNGGRKISIDTDAPSVPRGLKYSLLTKPQRSEEGQGVEGDRNELTTWVLMGLFIFRITGMGERCTAGTTITGSS